MRIGAYNQISQIYKSNISNTIQQSTPVQSTDEVQISQIGKDFQIAKAAVASSSDVREDVVNSLKEQIKNGIYSVSSEDFANKLIEQYDKL